MTWPVDAPLDLAKEILVPNADQIFAKAQALQSAGRFSEAEPLFRSLLSSDNATAEIYCRHAACCQALGAHRDAIASLRRAIILRNDNADAYHRLGALLAHEGALDEAIESLQTARALRPKSAETEELLRRVHAANQSERAAELARQGHLPEATGLFQTVSEQLPGDSDAHYNLGFVFLQQGRIAEAVESFERSLSIDGGRLDARFQLANAMVKQVRLNEAAVQYHQILESSPNHVAALANLGNVLRDLEQYEESAACLRRAVAISPESAELLNSLGVALMNSDRPDDALACYDQATGIDPNYVDPYVNRATVHLMRHQPVEALAQCDRALQLDPASPSAIHNKCFALLSQRKLDEVLAQARRAVELNPTHAEAHLDYGLMLLMAGRFEQGWHEYEWRWQRAGEEPRSCEQPRWSGEPLAGLTILLWTERGLGDSLQCVRYAEIVAEHGATVVREFEAPLVPLVSRCCGVHPVSPRGAPVPRYDVHAPLMSLPMLCNTTPETIPSRTPYLSPDATEVARWHAELAGDGVFKIGIVWRGNAANVIDRRRSIPLAQFEQLARLPGVCLYSLQVGPARDELSTLAPACPITDLGEGLSDFHETAAVMRNLDLVVTCDSSPAHLAGGLGAEVWVALPDVPDWRWTLDGERTAWYPTMRLFRQEVPGDWDSVFRRIAGAVATRLRHGEPPLG